MITKVTITGADNSIEPSELNELTYRFPFVEWGILVSRKSSGNPRFPSKGWIDKLYHEAHESMKISCHLCGAYVREFCMGEPLFQEEIGKAWAMFERVQINTHGSIHDFDKNKMLAILFMNPKKEFIFQNDGINTLFEHAVKIDANCSTLFDLSHGAGVTPNEWPIPIPNIKCGYAGGLSPESIEEQIKIIESKVGDTEIWIDMETHVRSNNDKLFDLKKVEKCLSISSKYIS